MEIMLKYQLVKMAEAGGSNLPHGGIKIRRNWPPNAADSSRVTHLSNDYIDLNGFESDILLSTTIHRDTPVIPAKCLRGVDQ